MLPAKRQVIPRSWGTDPEPAMSAWAHGTDGVGPALLSPGSAPVRWLPMDGYVYNIRDDLGGSYRRMVMVVPGHVTDGDGGAGIGHARSDALMHAGWIDMPGRSKRTEGLFRARCRWEVGQWNSGTFQVPPPGGGRAYREAHMLLARLGVDQEVPVREMPSAAWRSE